MLAESYVDDGHSRFANTVTSEMLCLVCLVLVRVQLIFLGMRRGPTQLTLSVCGRGRQFPALIMPSLYSPC